MALTCKQVDEPMTDEMMMAMANTENNGEFLQVSTQHGRGPSLKDPEIFIGDTGATRHWTFCAEGGVNSRAATSADMVQGLTGGPTKAKSIIDIPVWVDQEDGRSPGRLCDVSHTPEFHYNLCSITQLLRKGYVLTGAESSAKMTRPLSALSSLPCFVDCPFLITARDPILAS